MNTERLLALAKALDEKVPPQVEFNLSHWAAGVAAYLKSNGEVREDLPEGFCGTTACAVGTACLLPEFQEQGLSLNPGAGGFVGGLQQPYPAYCDEDGIVWSGWLAANKFFDLEGEEASHLFSDASYRTKDRTGAKTVANRIRKFVKKGGI